MTRSADMNHLGREPAVVLDSDTVISEVPDRALSAINAAVVAVQSWIEKRDYAGHEPYDILNSPLFGTWVFGLRPLSWSLLRIGRRGGMPLRRVLRVPTSKNPKALGLMLAGYCDRLRLGEDCWPQMNYLKSELQRLRSTREEHFSWGYDWNFVALRGTVLPAFQPNAIATIFCGNALLDMAQTGGSGAREMAESAGRFIVARLNRSVDTASELCFSYTPWDRTRIYNSSALAGAFLTRLGVHGHNSEYVEIAKRCMRYLCREQRPDGSWFYGAGRLQRWIDSFHTAYNLEAILAYRQLTGDRSMDNAIERGYEFYVQHFFDRLGAPKYFHDRLYPIDIHCCSQSILTLCSFVTEDAKAQDRALRMADWTLTNMTSSEGCFYYQKHRLWQDRTPYMRWGQAWMFRALARLQNTLGGESGNILSDRQYHTANQDSKTDEIVHASKQRS
jgi:hypothetical protein